MSLLNDKQMSNKVGVGHQAAIKLCSVIEYYRHFYSSDLHHKGSKVWSLRRSCWVPMWPWIFEAKAALVGSATVWNFGTHDISRMGSVLLSCSYKIPPILANKIESRIQVCPKKGSCPGWDHQSSWRGLDCLGYHDIHHSCKVKGMLMSFMRGPSRFWWVFHLENGTKTRKATEPLTGQALTCWLSVII